MSQHGGISVLKIIFNDMDPLLYSNICKGRRRSRWKKAFILGLFPQLSYIHSIIRHKKQKRNYSALNRFVKPFYTVSLLSIFWILNERHQHLLICCVCSFFLKFTESSEPSIKFGITGDSILFSGEIFKTFPQIRAH